VSVSTFSISADPSSIDRRCSGLFFRELIFEAIGISDQKEEEEGLCNSVGQFLGEFNLVVFAIARRRLRRFEILRDLAIARNAVFLI
jgi:hypothetical protein